MAHNVGDTVTLDGIECLIIYDNGSEAEWGRYIVTDKNHDLCYYSLGSDFVDDTNYSTNKWGFEWGGYGVVTGITSQGIGDGLSNTNSLIDLNLQAYSGGTVIWTKVSEFRQSHSDKWFVPTVQELQQMFSQRDYLNNLSIIMSYSCYWSSSEKDIYGVDVYDNNNSNIANGAKHRLYYRSRLCRYATELELDSYEKKVWTTNEIITAIELNRIENRINELYSSYESHEWSDGEIITSGKLNNIETQLGTDKTWEDGEIITEDKLNDIEDHLVG